MKVRKVEEGTETAEDPWGKEPQHRVSSAGPVPNKEEVVGTQTHGGALTCSMF